MDKKEKEEYQKKIKLYERLGAIKFQKVVFKVEDLKFKIIKKCFPNFIHHFDKYCDWRQKRAIKRATSEEEIKQIRSNTKLAKMAMRKELNEEKNRNYHMDPNHPTEILRYLNWNKDVHKRGLIKNGILIPIAIAGIIFHIPGAIAVLVFELLSSAINFECMNIQNYNICRIERMMPTLKKREEKMVQKKIEEYGAAAEVIHKSIEQSENLPTMDEIIGNIENPEQLRQLREMLLKEKERRNNNTSNINENIRGNGK